jgi:hypothetical protein
VSGALGQSRAPCPLTSCGRTARQAHLCQRSALGQPALAEHEWAAHHRGTALVHHARQRQPPRRAWCNTALLGKVRRDLGAARCCTSSIGAMRGGTMAGGLFRRGRARAHSLAQALPTTRRRRTATSGLANVSRASALGRAHCLGHATAPRRRRLADWRLWGRPILIRAYPARGWCARSSGDGPETLSLRTASGPTWLPTK